MLRGRRHDQQYCDKVCGWSYEKRKSRHEQAKQILWKASYNKPVDKMLCILRIAVGCLAVGCVNTNAEHGSDMI